MREDPELDNFKKPPPCTMSPPLIHLDLSSHSQPRTERAEFVLNCEWTKNEHGPELDKSI